MNYRHSTAIGIVCWCGMIVFGNIVYAIRIGHYWEYVIPNCFFDAFLFLPQLATACILINCYDEIDFPYQGRILMALGIFHNVLMFGEISLFFWEDDVFAWAFINFAIFLITGLYLMLQSRKGIVIALLSLIAWIQPFIYYLHLLWR